MGWDWIFGSELCSPFDCGFAYHAPREPVGGHTVPLTTSLAFAVFPGEKGPLVSMSVVSMKKPTYRDFRMVGLAGFWWWTVFASVVGYTRSPGNFKGNFSVLVRTF